VLVGLVGGLLILQGIGAIANHMLGGPFGTLFLVAHLSFLAGYRGYASFMLAVLGLTLVVAASRAGRPSAAADEAGVPTTGTRARSALAPAVGLFLLAPLVGEYLLGNVPISEIFALPILALMYGGGALLVREVTRRLGRGWPTMFLLALAYGVIEPGLLDHSLFNPSFEGLDALNSPSYVPALGLSAANALSYPVGHAVWSISVPIAVVETLVPARRTTPWLGTIGLAVTAMAYLLGGALVFNWARTTEGFLPSIPQMLGAGIVAAGLIVVAFLVGRSPRPTVDRRAPKPWLVGASAFVVSSLYSARGESWWDVGVGVVLVGVAAVVVARWSRRSGWGAAHRLALAGGALLTYAWLGFVLLVLKGTADTLNLTGQGLLVAGAIVLLSVARAVVRKEPGHDESERPDSRRPASR